MIFARARGALPSRFLCHSEDTRATLVDVSPDALALAKENAEKNGVLDRCTFLECDLIADFPKGLYDLIVSNPPYVLSEVVDTLEEECSFEPRIAFDGGVDGGDFYRRILEEGPKHLKAGGKMVFEIGYDQRPLMKDLSKKSGFALEIFKDYGKNDRVAVFVP